MFICPNCKADLNKTMGQKGIVWICPQCNGRAVNLSVLRQLVDRGHFNRVWQTAWEASVRSERSCPSCQKAMIEVPVNPPPDPLVLDVCKSCQFVWFDPSELEKMPAAPPPPQVAEPELPPEAKRILAEHKVRQMAEQNRQAESADAWLSTIEGFWHILGP
jgi:Zn-finger nucleic acid-binding protein